MNIIIIYTKCRKLNKKKERGIIFFIEHELKCSHHQTLILHWFYHSIEMNSSNARIYFIWSSLSSNHHNPMQWSRRGLYLRLVFYNLQISTVVLCHSWQHLSWSRCGIYLRLVFYNLQISTVVLCHSWQNFNHFNENLWFLLISHTEFLSFLYGIK